MTFDHRQPTTDEAQWAASPVLDAAARIAAPTPPCTVIVVAAHPDDESLGAGGLINQASRAGCTVRIVVASDGEASHPNSATHSKARLATIRRAEVIDAIELLAPGSTVTCLGLPDGDLSAHLTEIETAIEAAVGTAIERGASPNDPTWLVTPWIEDGHPDHSACAQAGRAVATRRLTAGTALAMALEYPIWAWHWDRPHTGTSTWTPGSTKSVAVRRLELDEIAMTAKAAALAQHVSQTEDLSDAPGDAAILPAGVIAHFQRDFETFVRPPHAAPAALPGYFDALYASNRDPWGLADRFYERRKREVLLASLPRPRFTRAFEPGCAIGLLTAALANRCNELIAMDVSRAALAQARSRIESTNVELRLGRIPDDWPAGAFDLIVLSEVGYYCPDLDALRSRINSSLSIDGALIALHWRHVAVDHATDAQTVHAAVGLGLHRIARHDEADFLLDIWTPDGRSVAQLDHVIP